MATTGFVENKDQTSSKKARRPSTAGHTRPGTAAGKPPTPVAVANPGIKMLIDKIKKEMKSRGSFGFIGLQRRFKIMDDDGSKSLNQAEFRKAMKEMTLDLSDADLRMLFNHFDVDRNGSVDFEEFIAGVRDPMSDKRLALVRKGRISQYTCLDFCFTLWPSCSVRYTGQGWQWSGGCWGNIDHVRRQQTP